MRTTPLFVTLAVLTLVACTPTAPVVIQEDNHNQPHVTIAWVVTEKSTDAYDQVTFGVALNVTTDGKTETVMLGEYAGCGQEAVPEDGPLLTLSCWWAGAGDDFQVRMEGTDTLVVDHRGVDEMMPVPEFTPMKTVRILTGSEIVTTPMKKT